MTLATAMLLSSAAHAVIVVNEGFEVPDVNNSQSDGNTSGAIPSGWVGAQQGFGGNRRGIVDESHGDFTDPVGEQAFAFRYTNSGLTSGLGLIGNMTAGETYNVSFDVVMDGHNAGLPWRVKFVVFDEFAARDDVRDNNGTTVLYEANGNATSDGLYTNISFNYLADEVTDAASLGKDLAIRFVGATSSATIDNVVVDVDLPASEFFLKLIVDTVTGETTLVGRPTGDVEVNYYQITSAGNSLNATGWSSFDDQNLQNAAWLEAGGSGPHSLAEGLLEGSTTVLADASMPLGLGYNTAINARDLVFAYRVESGQIYQGTVEYLIAGDYDGNGIVEAADYTIWRQQFGSSGTPGEFAADGNRDGTVNAADYTVWRDNLGASVAATLATGATSVPEPGACCLLLLLLVSALPRPAKQR